ncbi:amidohydrolase family protein [Mucilaginibacter sp. KACC 22773]|jgi:L-fuconolactonase|uniref:amidohydrolase family protein n=1 Tax=Mucilaginibacter sp. KACC 22773 TaxID=3025671 RepID=UPI0023656803|nr:amidohydrolase family protein [Mucilaginibacter sp. KACC 22773]WDF75372.1 amidohydrolase family protein [Mucilaginibacter sp. KACC 22773]
MLKIDSHQHFWIFDPVRDSWIDDQMLAIKRDFSPVDLLPVLQQHGIDGCVSIQASQTNDETMFLLDYAAANPFVKGIVGWVNLKADDLEKQLQQYKNYDKLKGFRHVLQSEGDDQYMLQPAFQKGIGMLEKYGYTYDILIFPRHLPFANQLTGNFPNQKFVVDHLAKPHIKNRKISDWQKDIEALAKHENVSCKISGMLTEADWANWKVEDFTPYLDVIFNAFGPGRVMFGSDWPVCLLAGGYEGTMQVTQNYIAKLSATEQEQFWGGNAISFYNL